MYNTDEAIKQTLKDIEAMEECNKVLPEIKKVISKWDGKVFNKRIEADLKALNLPGHIYLSTCYDERWEINYSPEGSHKWFSILHTMKPSNKYYDKDKSFMDPDKRVSAERSFQMIEAGRVERLKTITAYKDTLNTWQEKKAQIEMLKKQISTITATIPYALQDYFNIRARY